MTTPAVFTRPTLTTKFHIDFDWWKENDQSWRINLIGYLCETHKPFFENASSGDQLIDSIDSETAEIRKLDTLQDTLFQHCAQTEGFLQASTALTDVVFRLLLSQRNTPLSPQEISEIIDRPAETILKTLSGARIYKGIRAIA